MKKLGILQCSIQLAEEGGYTAQAVGFPILPQGETLDETVKNIKEAAECHFEDISSSIRSPLPIMVHFEAGMIV
jgi:predicted RNase H-like HicB family nuclease